MSEKKKCQLCGSSKGKAEMWCGGPWGWAHYNCVDIASKGISMWLYHQRWLREQQGIQYSTQRGWWCEECDELYPFKTRSECPKGHGKMKVAMTYHSSEFKEKPDARAIKG